MTGAAATPAPVGYAAPLRNREFRGITIAQVISECGEQLARIALAVLVFEDSQNVFYTALTYAVGYLPFVIGGALLGSLADWLPRRQVMLACHASRAVLVALIALPGVPLAVAFCLLAAISLLEAPFAAARSALVPELLRDGPTYVAGVSLSRALHQIDQAAGFFLGGIVLAVLSPQAALLLDSAGFVIAYLVVLVMVRERPAAAERSEGGLRRDVRVGVDAVFRHPARRSLVVIVWLGGLCLILPEGVAVTYAHELGGGALASGILTAAMPAGLFIGAILMTKRVPARRQADSLLVLAALASLLLTLTAASPPIWLTAVIWMASGACQVYVIPAIATFNLAVEGENRGRAVGLAAAGLALAQGLSLAGGGALAAEIGPEAAVAWFAVAGLAGVAVLSAWWPHRALADLADEAFGRTTPQVELAASGLSTEALSSAMPPAPVTTASGSSPGDRDR